MEREGAEKQLMSLRDLVAHFDRKVSLSVDGEGFGRLIWWISYFVHINFFDNALFLRSIMALRNAPQLLQPR